MPPGVSKGKAKGKLRDYKDACSKRKECPAVLHELRRKKRKEKRISRGAAQK